MNFLMVKNIVSFQAKEHLIESIEKFYNEKIVVAGRAISEYALNKIANGDVILVYGGYVYLSG